MSGSFFDTNVLVYLAVGKPESAAVVKTLLVGGGAVSVQVLNELVNVTRRKYRKPWPEVVQFTGYVKDVLTVVPLTIAVHEYGMQLAQQHNFSIYDSLIVAAALSINCDTLWSEDMQHGMIVDGRLTIRNPFREALPSPP